MSNNESNKTRNGSLGRRFGPAALTFVILFAVAASVAFRTRWQAPPDGTPQRAMRAGQTGRSTGTTLWTCSMHPQVIRDEPGLCPVCHMELSPLNMGTAVPDEARHDIPGAAHGGPVEPAATGGGEKKRKVKYWWDPMLNPPYISDKPGKSPMGMDLIPVYEDEAPSSSAKLVTIDPVVVQNMGVRVENVTEGPLRRTFRVVGYLTEAEPNIREVNLRVSGWVRRLYANTEGMHVKAGAALFALYSPELQVAVEELLAARRSKEVLGTDARGGSRGATAGLYEATARKLELIGLSRGQLQKLAKLGRTPETITFTSPITGDVTEKLVVEGAALKAGDRVLRIVDHSTLWLDARVFEQQLPFVKIGQKATATVASRPGEDFEGEIIFIHPRLDVATRTATVRLAIPNPALALRPGMFAEVTITAELADRAVMVPREAVIDRGTQQLAFVARDGGRFEPRSVKMGLPAENGMIQVIEGLLPGESVVVSGQFLLDSESRLREAIRKFLDAKKQPAPAPAPQVATTVDAAGGRPK